MLDAFRGGLKILCEPLEDLGYLGDARRPVKAVFRFIVDEAAGVIVELCVELAGNPSLAPQGWARCGGADDRKVNAWLTERPNVFVLEGVEAQFFACNQVLVAEEESQLSKSTLGRMSAEDALDGQHVVRIDVKGEH